MPLINCSACSKPVSSRAIKCPNCGEPIFPSDIEPAQFTKEEMSKWGWTSLGLIILGMYSLDLSLEHGNLFYGLGMLLGALGSLGLTCWAIMVLAYLTGQ
jgi:hypothetical protein